MRDMLYIFEEGTEKELTLSDALGPRAVARGLNAVFNSNAEWDDRHIGTVALLCADYTSGDKGVIYSLIREVRRADLQIVFLN